MQLVVGEAEDGAEASPTAIDPSTRARWRGQFVRMEFSSRGAIV